MKTIIPFTNVDTRMARWRGQQDKAWQALYKVAGWTLAALPAGVACPSAGLERRGR